VVFVVVFDVTYHEYWRDEIQPVLIGRQWGTPGFLRVARLEGVPPGFYALCGLVDALLAPPWGLAVVGGLGYATLLGGTYTFLRAVSRRRDASLRLTAALAPTAPFLYDLGVVVRQYSMGLGLVLAGSGLMLRAIARRRQHVLPVVLVLLGALTSAHATCLAVGAVCAYGLVAVTRRELSTLAKLSALCLPVFGAIACVLAPHSARAPQASHAHEVHLLRAPIDAWLLFHRCLANSGWWREEAPAWAYGGLGVTGALLLAFYTISLIGAARARARPEALYLITWHVCSVLPLMYIFLAWYWGAPRHHWFVVMPLVLGFLGFAVRRNCARGPQSSPHLAPRALLLALPCLLFHYESAAHELSMDARRPFAATRAAAPHIDPGATVVLESDHAGIGLLYYRPDLVVYAANGETGPLRSMVPNHAWQDRRSYPATLRLACAARAAPVLAIHQSDLAAPVAACARLRTEPVLPLKASEAFRVSSIDCSCLFANAEVHELRAGAAP
jgi:hypothetical protein